MIKLSNPITAFIFTWLFVLLLYSIRCSYLLTKLNFDTVFYIGLSCFAFLLSYIFCRYFITQKINYPNYFTIKNIQNKLKVLLYIWIAFTSLEIIYFRSLPILALFGIGNGAYTEWGIPSLHGVLNAMILVISNYNFYLYLTTKNNKYLKRFLLCLAWPLVLVTRQVLMSMVIQAAFIYISINKIRPISIIKLILIGLFVVYFFGLIGDLRSGDPETFLFIAQPAKNYPSFLPTGFLWVYIYITSPLNNVNFNIYTFHNFDFSPVYVLSSFFPSFLRGLVFPGSSVGNLKLVEDWLNVSSMFPNYLWAFGYYGSLIFYFFLGTFFSAIYFKTKTRKVNVKWVFILVVLLHNIAFSVFVDFFSSLPFVFQMMLHFIIGTKFDSLKNEI